MSHLHIPKDVKAGIICAIERFPELWDPESDVKNKVIIASLWEKVAKGKNIGLPVQKVKSHWQALKRSYIEHINGGKQMDPDLYQRMYFMHYVLSAPQKKRTSCPSQFNQPGGSKKVHREPPLHVPKVTVDFGSTSAQFIPGCDTSTFTFNHSTGAKKQTKKPAKVQKPKATKVNVPRTKVPQTPAASKDIMICSWIAGHLLGQNDSIVSSSAKQFKHDMLELLKFFKPHLVREILEDPSAAQIVGNIPVEVCQALLIHNSSNP